MKSKYAVATVAMIVIVRLRALATKLSYSCIMDIIAAHDFTDRFSDCSGNTNERSRTSYQCSGDKNISDYNWRMHSMALPTRRHSELNSKLDLGSGRSCMRYNDCNHHGIHCASAIEKSLLLFKLLESNLTMSCS